LRSRRRIALTALAVCSVLVVTLWHGQGAWRGARALRDATTSSPTLAPLFSRAVVKLEKGDEACVEPVTYYADTARGRFRMRVPRAPAPNLVMKATAPGYDATATVKLPVQVEGTVNVEFREPGREVTGRWCWQNRGPTPVQLIGTNEGRSLTIADLTVNGRRRDGEELELVLFERGGHSLRSRRGELIDRAASMTGGLAPEWILWPVALLLFGSPLIVAALFGLSVWRSEDEAARTSRAPDEPTRAARR
jgi:hypothetical protein